MVEKAKVLYVRNIPPELSRKLRAAAALHGGTLQAYLVQLLQEHVEKLERTGQLPKGK